MQRKYKRLLQVVTIFYLDERSFTVKTSVGL